jgi:hypothetical protein
MAATRREFLSMSLIAGAGLALPGKAFAQSVSPEAAEAGAGASTALDSASTVFTRGIGMYPGAPSENFQPELLLDADAPYRNLALLRPAYASSSYDYNLTAQLVTDGLVDTVLPQWITTVVDGQILPKTEREIVVDHFQSAVLELPSSNPAVELHLGGGAVPSTVDRLELFVVVPGHVVPDSLTFTVSVSDDAHTWRQTGSVTGGHPLPTENYPPDLVRGSQLLNPSVVFDRPFAGRYFRATFASSRPPTAAAANTANAGTTEAAMAGTATAISWRLGQIAFFHGQQRINLGGPYSFTSAWKSATLDEEWVSVDLGSVFAFDNVKLHWIARAAEGKLQVSDDNRHWQDVQSLTTNPASPGTSIDDLKLTSPARGRYVRVLMTRPQSPEGYILSELEVFGHGGFIAKPAAMPAATANGTLNLAGGRWKVQRAGYNGMQDSGEVLAGFGFKDDSWVVATVPGTVLTSYLNAGAIPDPNYGQNQLHISDSFFFADFWYRTEFVVPAARAGKAMMLNFEGINWKADVYLNGTHLGRVDGGFMRGRFDVTSKLVPGKTNALAILIHKNDTPGSCKQKTLETTGKNGGALGADNPTYHASIGWDWIPTIRGRNTGIWAEINLVPTAMVTLEDPLVSCVLPLPDTSHADVSVECVAVNHTGQPFEGTLRGRFGTLEFVQRVIVPPNGRQRVRLSPESHEQFRIVNPELWWPAGYGEPHLYEVELSLEGHGETHDHKRFKAGIRQITSDEKGGKLHLYINGRRLIAKGGSWGFSESMLRYRAREYDAAVRYHREMNFNMIRNWVGQIGDEAFYEACDRHGILIWQDFWLANPWDGPVPENDRLFLDNSRDFISRIRRHPSIGIYCGRNEWFPPRALDAGLRAQLAELHPDMPYIGSSADGPVSGHGPYRALTAPEYFKSADTKLHSEIGAPAIPPIESVRLMMPGPALWPLSLDYGLHDFTYQGAQGGEAFLTLLNEGYGGAGNVEEWVALGEIISYEAYRAIFEAQSVHRMGALLWMSHPCWPSFVWQTYDFYLQPTASYYGSKLGSEPLHIQWNSFQEAIEVVNYSAGSVTGLVAKVEILNMDGSTASVRSAQLDSTEDSTASIIALEYPAHLSSVHFLRLTLTQGGSVRSTNFYLRGTEQGNYRAIRTLNKATVVAHTTSEQRGDRWFLTTSLQNTSAVPALFVRVQAEREVTGDRILPAIYDANYIALMPNESRTVRSEFFQVDTRGESPRVRITGFNMES